MPSQQFVILAQEESSGNGLVALGSRRDVLDSLLNFNTSPERAGEDVLFGPGIRIELPPEVDPIEQMLLTVTEDEIGWQVIQRLATRLGWRLLDPMSGREWKPS